MVRASALHVECQGFESLSIYKMLETKFNRNHTLYKNLLVISGIGPNKAELICKILGIKKNKKLSELPIKHIENIYKFLTLLKKQSSTSWDLDNSFFSNDIKNSLYTESLLNNNLLQIKDSNLLNNKKIVFHNLKIKEYDYISSFNILSSQKYISFNINKIKNNMIPTLIEDNLKQDIKNNISNLINTNSYRGRRLKMGYPSKGQRTRSNARTSRKKLYFY